MPPHACEAVGTEKETRRGRQRSVPCGVPPLCLPRNTKEGIPNKPAQPYTPERGTSVSIPYREERYTTSSPEEDRHIIKHPTYTRHRSSQHEQETKKTKARLATTTVLRETVSRRFPSKKAPYHIVSHLKKKQPYKRRLTVLLNHHAKSSIGPDMSARSSPKERVESPK